MFFSLSNLQSPDESTYIAQKELTPFDMWTVLKRFLFRIIFLVSVYVLNVEMSE